MKIWRYVITHDTGFAPNFAPPAATLATCMPAIRRKAQQGEVLLAFNGKSLSAEEPHSVRWAGVVAEIIPLAEYWDDNIFRVKRPSEYGGSRLDASPDNIYKPTPSNEFEQVSNKWHGPSDMSRDTGGHNVLAFQRYWYFGSTIAVLPEYFNLRITGGRRRERQSEIDAQTWHNLQEWLDENVPASTTAPVSQQRCPPVRKRQLPASTCSVEKAAGRK